MNGFLSWWGSHFTPMLSWWQWLLVLAVPPAIILLYFLKLKRQPLEVPSTYLWRKSIEDLHVNSIWQRLRQSLLLFLQLLIVALAIFALLRPGWRGSKLVGHRLVFLVDNSASMSATDIADTRLAEAKRRVADLIDQMRSGDEAMIVSFSDIARVEQLFTDNRRELRRQLDAIRPTNRSTSLAEALRVASGMADAPRAAPSEPDDQEAESPPTTLYIFSDGKFADVPGFSLGSMKPIYVPIGKQDSHNVGITAFAVQQAEGRTDRRQAFARIENFGRQPAKVKVTLQHEGNLIDADEVTVKANEATGVTFDLNETLIGMLGVTIDPGGNLPNDDRAWVVVSPPRKARVLLVTPGDDALEFALSTPRAAELADVSIAAPSVLQTKEHERLAVSGAYDLIIYDQCQPKTMPQANTLFIGRLPPLPDWGYVPGKPAEKLVAPQVIDVQSAHPLMRLIDLGNVTFAEAISLKLPPGGTALIDSNLGVLFGIASREGFEDAVLASEIVGTNEAGQKYANTDWPLRLSFPVFVLNTVEYLGGTRQTAGVGAVAPGQIVALRATTDARRLTVTAPDGRTVELSRTLGGTFNFADTEQLGGYRVQEKGQAIREFAVNLFDSAESDIRPRSENNIKIGYVEVAGGSGLEGTRRELWRPLLLLALFVLVAEWYIYNRRVYL